MTPRSTSPWFEAVPDEPRFGTLHGWVTADVAVIGGGIVGVMTAWNLAAKGRSVALLEANHIATGDTGLTTAFLTRVPDTGAADLLEAHGADWLAQLFAATADAQRWFKTLVRAESLDCDLMECSSYNCSYDEVDAPLLEEWRAINHARAGAALVSDVEASRCGVASVRQAIRFDGEARFHVRKLVFGLLARPGARRIQVFENTAVTGLEVDNPIVVRTTRGSVLCRSVVCASGLPIEPLRELRPLVTPVLTFAVAARYQGAPPMSDSLFWDTDEPYQYFRLLDANTIILGGCDRPAAEQASGRPPHERLRDFLRGRLTGPHEIVHEWSGTLFDTTDGLPYIAAHPRHPGRVFVATGFGGNGMVMGTMAGRILADLVTGSSNAYASLFDFTRTGIEISTADSSKPAARDEIAVFTVDGETFGLDNACSHAGGPLCDGAVDGVVVRCPWHGSEFDVTSGAVRRGPASRPQRCYAVRVNRQR